MVFLDSSGFFALVGLLMQCGLAWVLAGVFALLLRHESSPRWFRHWLVAYLAFACGLTAIGLRFFLSNVSYGRGPHEGEALTRGLYAFYQCGKGVFAWQLLVGIAALRGERHASLGWRLPAVVLPYAAIGAFAVPTIEHVLLLQIPVVVATQLLAGHWLRLFHRQRRDPGSRIAADTLTAWAVFWLLYLVPVFLVVSELPGAKVAVATLRFASYFDLTAQVALAAGMIALVFQDANHGKLAAIAERDRLRDVVAHDEKLRAIGTLVSGVAHELNNPLTAVLGFADDLLSSDPEVRGRAAQIVREQAERCRGIVQSLSMLAGPRSQRREPVDVADLVARVARGFAPQLATARVSLTTDCAPALPTVRGDRVALEQVLTNLLANAVQATPAHGRVTVTAANNDLGVEIRVRDTGQGVGAAIAERLFEPFFTTKPTGQGTGLGLPLARALARAHGGDVRLLQSVPGDGAEFVLWLPVQPEPTASDALPAMSPGPLSTLRLLIVDDEPLVRELVARYASMRGWSVSQASGGEAALSLVLADRAAFDAVVCDLRMPGVSGIQIHDRLLREAPDLLRRFVFVTGDLASPEAAGFVHRSRCPLIEKPFDLNVLLREVERVAA